MTMLQEIQDKIADKTLSFGCLIKYNSGLGDVLGQYIGTYDELNSQEDIEIQTNREHRFMQIRRVGINFTDHILRNDKFEIIGHPVMIGDVLEYLDDKGGGLGINQRYNDYGHTEIYSDGLDTIDLICAWKDLKKPINDQSPETIKAIYGIVCKGL